MEARYGIGALIGKGAYGTVHKVKRRKTGETFAMKTIPRCREMEIKKMRALKDIDG